MSFSGWVATLAGWLVTEIGRQPYLVYGVLPTADAAAAVPASNVALTLVAYRASYALLLLSYLVVLTQLARHRRRATTMPTGSRARPAGKLTEGVQRCRSEVSATAKGETHDARLRVSWC